VSLEAQVDGKPRLLQARLLVAADGGDSRIRQRLGFSLREWSYGHTAVISTVTPDRPQSGQAFERFTDTGPLAMLPLTGGRYSTVWTVRDETAAHLLTLSHRDFLDGLQECFGYRMGRLERLGRRVAYPLRLLQVKQPVHRRLVLIGNAAHTIHPVAGQGFNLGIRDAAGLADVLKAVADRGGDSGDPSHLQRYAEWRRRDQSSVALITDALARVFSNPLAPVRLARNLGLLGLDLAPGLKHLAARQFMGLRGHQLPLSRG
jgi:2-octaprenyl-6-methoxyphenol hydroxylase